MRLTKPRIEPLEPSAIAEELRRYMADGPALNIYRTVAHHAKLTKRWLVFATHVLGKSSLPARDRELLILRTGFLCRSEYEWAQHSVIARMCGISDEEILRVADGPSAPGWSTFDAALLRAADELHEDSFVTDATWQTLAARYGTEQLIDLVFAVGQYTLVSMVLNTLGVQLEPDLPGWPEAVRVKLKG